MPAAAVKSPGPLARQQLLTSHCGLSSLVIFTLDLDISSLELLTAQELRIKALTLHFSLDVTCAPVCFWSTSCGSIIALCTRSCSSLMVVPSGSRSPAPLLLCAITSPASPLTHAQQVLSRYFWSKQMEEDTPKNLLLQFAFFLFFTHFFLFH